MLNKRELGSEYETRACKYLEDKGYSIIERNFYSKHKEIDIIARDKEYLVFIEVKYRKDNIKGTPLDAVNYLKRKNIIRAARYYIHKNYYGMDVAVRFDVVSIEGDNIVLIKDAFWLE